LTSATTGDAAALRDDFKSGGLSPPDFPFHLCASAIESEDKPATVTLFVNGEQVGQGAVNRTHPGQFSLSETFDVGEDTGTPVSKNYTRDNAFSGNLEKLVVALK
jgi:arylsulfatase